MSNTETWQLAGKACDLEDEEVMRFDHDGKTFAIYNLGGNFHATDGNCTHEKQHLCDGFVIDGIIECPLHMGQFDIETGEALAGPVCVDLNTYDVKIEDGEIYLRV